MNAHFIGSQLYKYEFFGGRSGIGCLQRRKSYKYFIIPVLKSHRIVKQSAAGADISSWSGSDRKNGKTIRSPNNVLENVENEKEMSATKTHRWKANKWNNKWTTVDTKKWCQKYELFEIKQFFSLNNSVTRYYCFSICYFDKRLRLAGV